ncbi:TonB-dependent receptor [Belliella sp. DSM 111904]|uniref:TonB-dependent receptor n=1 Tax=Belliella filtrata TaxID=2923435 RepID=A0ABS9UUV4_9BACT|nr:TonB-dependent receptor [Belliella filtrata]MCH7407854.1 TonB-dependent receptor [Belliella filtrata]
MKKRLLYLLFAMCIIGEAFSQNNASVVGRLSDGTGFLPGVNVLVLGSTQGAPTDLDGKFQISNLPQGNITLRFSYLGFETVELELDLKSGLNSIGTITMQEESGSLMEYVVQGTMAPSQLKAMSIKRNSLGIMDVIAADAIGKLPDRNAAEAVQRLPAASVNRYHGEANQVSVRGTPYAWSSTLYNGTRLPSANVFGNRNALLDAIPAEMIQYVQLSKAITPDMEGDAIGGSINFITRSAPDEQMLNASLAGGYNQRSENSSYNASIVYGNRFLNNKLGVIVAGAIWNRNFAADEIAMEYNVNRTNPAERYSINTLNAKRYFGYRRTTAINAALEYEFNPAQKLIVRYVNDQFDDVRPVYESYYEFNENRYRYSNRESDYKTNLNGIELGGVHKLGSRSRLDWSFSDYEMYYRLETPPYMPANQKGLPIVQFRQSLQGNFGVRSVDGLVYNQFDSPDGNGIDPYNFDPKLTNSNDFLDPSRLRLQQMIIYQTDQRDNDKVGQINFTHNATSKFTLKTGVKVRLKENVGELTPLAFLPGVAVGIPGAPPFRFLNEFQTQDFPSIGTYFSEVNNQFDHLALNPLTQAQIFDMFSPAFFEENGIRDFSPASNGTTKFNGTENVYAAYIMGVYEFSKKLKFTGGIRNEYTDISMNSSQYDAATGEVEPITRNHAYNAFLPMIHLTYKPTEQSNLRLAYTKTFARANFRDLNPSENVDITGGVPRISRGNTGLLPTFSHNFDIMGEYFLSDIGLITGGVFYKNISNFIFSDLSQETINGTNYLITQPNNLENSFLVGFEVGITKRFSGLPGILSGFGTELNYTRIHSELEVPRNDEQGQVIGRDITSLPNQSGNLFNVSLFYERNGLMLRLAGNYRGPALETINKDLGPDYYIFVGKNFTVDFSGAYSISEKVKAFAEVRNITNEPFVQYMGDNKNRITSSEWFSVNGQAGIRLIIF